MQPIEKTVIDRCVRQVYREMALGLETAKTPLLQDLYEELLRQPEPEASGSPRRWSFTAQAPSTSLTILPTSTSIPVWCASC